MVIVRECENSSDALVFHESPQHDDPTVQVGWLVDDLLVPGRCLLFDAFSISERTDISKIDSDQIQCTLGFPPPGA